MTTKVISYYPGSGGNRFVFYNEKHKKNIFNNWNNKEINYDTLEMEQYISVNRELKYLSFIDKSINEKYVLTHIMNYDILKEIFPYSKIYKIYTDRFILSIMRHCKILNKTIPETARILDWHEKFYKKSSVDKKADVLIDLDHDKNDFVFFINKELEIKTKQEEKLYNFFLTNGSNGPILDFLKNNYI